MIRVVVTGRAETEAALERLARESPARARAAMNRTVGVARSRVIKVLSRITGISRAVLGGRRGSGRRNVTGKGYIKQIRATRARPQAALVGLVAGVRFSNLRRRTLGRLSPAPGAAGKPFRATVASGHRSLYQRKTRARLPIKEVVIPIEPHASRAIRVLMLRAARTVYPQKIWEELRKSIKPVRS